MKFRIIATVIVLVVLIVLTVLFAPRPTAVNEDGTPIDNTVQQ